MAMKWNDSFEVGVPSMDKQHKRLMEMVNELDEAMSKGKGKEALGDILNRMADYTASHFKDEEALMEKYGYEDFEVHRQKHISMKGKVQRLIDDYKKGATTLSIETRTFLEQWLEKHIKGTDALYDSFSKKRVSNK